MLNCDVSSVQGYEKNQEAIDYQNNKFVPKIGPEKAKW